MPLCICAQWHRFLEEGIDALPLFPTYGIDSFLEESMPSSGLPCAAHARLGAFSRTSSAASPAHACSHARIIRLLARTPGHLAKVCVNRYCSHRTRSAPCSSHFSAVLHFICPQTHPNFGFHDFLQSL